MSVPLALIVGLGNPGPRYATTRHNAGFWLVDQIAARLRVPFNLESKFHGELARIYQPDIRLLKPTTFMNHSGRSVGALAQFFRLAPEQILVIHDELDLPPGKAKLKRGGGHGGHNGLSDIITQLGSQQFWRLRIGIGHPGHKDQVVDYVLRPPDLATLALIEDSLSKAMSVLPELIEGEMEAAMRILHRD